MLEMYYRLQNLFPAASVSLHPSHGWQTGNWLFKCVFKKLSEVHLDDVILNYLFVYLIQLTNYNIINKTFN